MKQRKKELIECAIKLFAEKGFQSTSVQDIVSNYGISKGAFYNYFSSKEKLLIAIFQYYFDKIREKVADIQQDTLEPREKMKKQIQAQFEFFIEHRAFIVMYFREQNQSINKELRQFLESNAYGSLKNTEENLLSIYGEGIKPYICDLVLLSEGLKHSYIKITIFDGVTVDIPILSEFIMNRIHDAVLGFIENKEKPVLKGKSIDSFISNSFKKEHTNTEKVVNLLVSMKEIVDQTSVAPDKKEELSEVIDFLIKECQNPEIKKYVFQGMLTNLKGVKEFHQYRLNIASLLNIELL